MVHALDRARRWVTGDGAIIDIHPTAAPARLVVQCAGMTTLVGELEDLTDGSGPRGRHARADEAMRTAVARGWLTLDAQRAVTFLHEALTLDDMLKHIAVEWRNARFAPATLARAAALMGAQPEGGVILEEDIILSRLSPRIG